MLAAVLLDPTRRIFPMRQSQGGTALLESILTANHLVLRGNPSEAQKGLFIQARNIMHREQR